LLATLPVLEKKKKTSCQVNLNWGQYECNMHGTGE